MRNIDISDPEFARRLIAAREHAGLSKSGLADKAGVSYRTIHNLEERKNRKVQEKTLLLLCEALDTSYPELALGRGSPEAETTLIPRQDAKRRRPLRARWLVAGGVILAIALVAVAARKQLVQHAVISVGTHEISARDPVFGVALWRKQVNSPVFCQSAPWDDRQILVARTSMASTALTLLDRGTGDEIWNVYPDYAEMTTAFGSAIDLRGLSCSGVQPIDIDGDDQQELLVTYRNPRDQGHCVAIVDRTGRRLHQYATREAIGEIACVDFDDIPGQEVIVTTAAGDESNECSIIILDGRHFGGADVDSDATGATDATPAPAVRDSSRARLVFPGLPSRLRPRDACRTEVVPHPGVQRAPGQDHARFSISISCGRMIPIHVELDDRLQLLRMVMSDGLLHAVRAQGDLGVANDDSVAEAWAHDYLAGVRRYVAGRRRPFGTELAGAEAAP